MPELIDDYNPEMRGWIPLMPEPLMTASEIAQHLRLHIETIYRLIQKEGLPAVKAGGQWRFRVSEVDRWLRVRAEANIKST